MRCNFHACFVISALSIVSDKTFRLINRAQSFVAIPILTVRNAGDNNEQHSSECGRRKIISHLRLFSQIFCADRSICLHVACKPMNIFCRARQLLQPAVQICSIHYHVERTTSCQSCSQSVSHHSSQYTMNIVTITIINATALRRDPRLVGNVVTRRIGLHEHVRNRPTVRHVSLTVSLHANAASPQFS